MNTDTDAPLGGIRVVEFGQLIASPLAGMVLADFGADVVKVESITGDPARMLLSPWLQGLPGANPTPTYLAFNRSKRSLAIDLKSDMGRKVARDLVASADVVIQAFRPGAMDRLGLGADELRAEHPELIYASFSAFGLEGPDRDRAGLDLIIQAESGIMAATGFPDGPPTKVGFQVIDHAAGQILAQGVLAALLARGRTGLGDHVQVSLLQVALNLQAAPFTEFLATGVQGPRTGNSASQSAPGEEFATADGSIVISAYTPHHWHQLCEALGAPELEHDASFALPASRTAHRADLRLALERILCHRSTDEWLDVLLSAGLAAGRINNYAQVIEGPSHDQATVTFRNEDGGESRVLRGPVQFQRWKTGRPTPPPLLGRDSIPILNDLGYTKEKIEALVRAGVVLAQES